jgi:hypothetical protein
MRTPSTPSYGVGGAFGRQPSIPPRHERMALDRHGPRTAWACRRTARGTRPSRWCFRLRRNRTRPPPHCRGPPDRPSGPARPKSPDGRPRPAPGRPRCRRLPVRVAEVFARGKRLVQVGIGQAMALAEHRQFAGGDPCDRAAVGGEHVTVPQCRQRDHGAGPPSLRRGAIARLDRLLVPHFQRIVHRRLAPCHLQRLATLDRLLVPHLQRVVDRRLAPRRLYHGGGGGAVFEEGGQGERRGAADEEGQQGLCHGTTRNRLPGFRCRPIFPPDST